MGDSNKSLIESWIAQHYTWDLTDAVKLLLGIDPAKDKKKIDLAGNEKVSRIYAWAIKEIKEGKLTAVSEVVSDSGETEYRVLRDDFVKWAKEHYKEWAKPLYAAMKDYNIEKMKSTSSEEIQKRTEEWQERLDERYIFFREKYPHKKNFHSRRCWDLANELMPNLPKKERGSLAATIRRYTSRRDKAWILGNMGKK